MTEQQASIFGMGTSVGELARGLFPGGVDASPATPYLYQQSVVDTARYITAGHTIIYEAAFQFDGVLAALDILVKKDGKWYGYEVKASTQVKPQFVEDVALQYYVITNAGIELADIQLIYMNNEYVRRGALNIQQLFSCASLKEEVVAMQEEVANKAKELKRIIASKEMPQIATGAQCTKPYTCDFYGHCWKDVVEVIEEKLENIDKAELKAFTQQLHYPLYYMDFETYILAVPEYDGHWPYRQVPFQFSVHIQKKKNGELKHVSFLADCNGDPCGEFIEKLVDVIDGEGNIVVYNQAFENTRLKELKEDYPAYADQIDNIQSRLVDLMVPFRKKHLYLPAMKGSYSIKYVLPALVPEMSYAGMTIANGGDASTAFYNLRNEVDGVKVEETREALLRYCELDTLAMVKILEKIRETLNGR